jgi:hypothetical protein
MCTTLNKINRNTDSSQYLEKQPWLLVNNYVDYRCT